MAKRDFSDWTGCPIRFFTGLLGDRWSLLILRDMAFNTARRYGDFLNAPEGISTNILADRLNHLQTIGLIDKHQNGRAVVYVLTEKGRSILPVLLAIINWGAETDPKTEVAEDFLINYRSGTEAYAKRLQDQILARDWELIGPDVTKTQSK